MRIVKVQVAAVFVAVLALPGSAFSQHDFDRTNTVDPSGNADFTTIQAAIDDFGFTPDKVTVLIYAGEYDENITLDGNDENIDLVGIDRESVIIAPSSGNGILITSGTETSRNNRITNLTIITTTGDGIRIVKGTAVPKDITIEGVTIQADGSAAIGVTGVDAENVTLTNCLVISDDSDGMKVGDHWTLSQVTVETIEDSTFNQDALVVGSHDFLTVTNSVFIGERRCIWLDGATDISFKNCRITSSGAGGTTEGNVVMQVGTKRVLFQDCLIVSDATLSGETRATPRAVLLSDSPITPLVEDIVFQSCRIVAIGDDSGSDSTSVVAVENGVAGQVILASCEVSAINQNATAPAAARGVFDGDIRVLGGVISSTSAAEKETEVWDVESSGSDAIQISGTRLSKWKGPIESPERPRPIIQRTLNVGSASATEIVNSADLDGDDVTVGASGVLDAYRAVQATWNSASGGNITITVGGTNWADEYIAEDFVLSEGTPNQKGFKPFKTVTDIFIPSASGTLSVGTTNKLGLYYPIASTSDVLQQGVKASAANSYTLESVSTPDATYATINLALGLIDGDSYEWAILVSQ